MNIDFMVFMKKECIKQYSDTYVVNSIWIILCFKGKWPILVIVDSAFANQIVRSCLGQIVSCIELNSWLIWVDFQVTSWFRVYNSEIIWGEGLKLFSLNINFFIR